MNKTISAAALILSLGSSLAFLPVVHAAQDMKMDKEASMEKDMKMDKNMADDKMHMSNDKMHMNNGKMSKDKMGKEEQMMKGEKHDNKM